MGLCLFILFESSKKCIMVRYFILLKRKSSKNWLGAIPAKKGASLIELRKIKTRPGFVKMIVSEVQLKSLISRLGSKLRTRTKRTVRRFCADLSC